MPFQSDKVDQFIHNLETVRNGSLSDEERAEIELWHKGKALRHLVGMYGWDVLLEMLQSYAQNAMAQLAAIPPGDDRVLAAHAAAFALADFYLKFRQDVDAAIEAANHMPTPVLDGVKRASPVPAESL